MRRIRVIPVLLLRNNGLYKTVKFNQPNYIGDPINAVKIFNDKEVDELVLLDITASAEKKPPNYKIIGEMASECFMPLAYGGGISSVDNAKKIFDLGVEKIIINTAFFSEPGFTRQLAGLYGSQSVVVSIDIKKNIFGKHHVYAPNTKPNGKLVPVQAARMAEENGAGEIILNSVGKDGTRTGFDLDLIREVSSSVKIPVVACGGADKVSDFLQAVSAGASAVSAGSMFVYSKGVDSVLINYPSPKDLLDNLYSKVS